MVAAWQKFAGTSSLQDPRMSAIRLELSQEKNR